MPAAQKPLAGPNPESLRVLARDDSARQEAAQKWSRTVDETSSLDVLERCKKLNEFLSSDFLKNGGKNKQDLQQILDILGERPKRPACLEKPPVTSTSGASSGVSSKRTSLADSAAAQRPLSGYDADKLLSLLGDDEPSRPATCSSGSSASATTASTSAATSVCSGPSEDLDDLIGLLNPASTPAMPAASMAAREQAEQAAREAARRAEEERKAAAAKAAAQAEAEARAAAEAEAARQKAAAAAVKARAEAEARTKAEAEAKAKREREAKEREEQERQRQAEEAAAAAAAEAATQAKRTAAALCIQRLWRGYAARLALRRVRQAATVLQAAVRARAARMLLVQELAVSQMRRRHAAAHIQRFWRAWVAGGRGWNLGPLRVAASGRPPSGNSAPAGPLGPLRMRSAADARLAKDAGDAVAAADDAAAQHRVVVATKARGSEVGEAEARRRAELGARAVMAGSEHRGAAGAVAVARATSLPRGIVLAGSGSG